MRKLFRLHHDLKYDHYVHLTTKCQVLKLQLSDKEGEREKTCTFIKTRALQIA